MYFILSGCRASERMLDVPVTGLPISNVRNSDMMCIIVRDVQLLA